jgi:hypothetical protein
VLPEIRAGLDAIEDHMIWLIKPDARFSVGQRVEFSRRGRAAGFPSRKASASGVVKKLEGFSLVVLLDGYRRPHAYHHAFFNPVSGPKLF